MKARKEIIAGCDVAIDKASDFFDNEANLAKKVGVSKQILNYWKKNMSLPLDMALEICVATGGKVRLEELYPNRSKTIKKYNLMIKGRYKKENR